MVKLGWKWSLHWLVVLPLLLAETPNLYANCKAPVYRVGKNYDYTAPTILLDISIRPEDFTREKLICLANVLKQKYRAPEVSVGIFNSYRAAVNYSPLGVEYTENAVRWASMRHAEYYYSTEKHEEYLLLVPDALSVGVNSPFSTRIDLPVTGKPSCKLQIHDRCLVTFDHIAATSEDGSGTVTLTARIEQSGAVSDVRIPDWGAITSSQQQALADFAMRNLRTWRFEQSRTKDEMRIMYSLEWVHTPLKDGVEVQFMLPDRVNIKMGPLEEPH